MSGNRILVDTNIFEFVFQGSATAAGFLEGKDVYISIINKIELLARKVYTKAEAALIRELLNATTVIHTNDLIATHAVNFRKTYNIKVPDALIAATALFQNIPLLTADKEFFKIAEVQIIEFYT